MSYFPKVPYVHVFDNLDFYYEFNDKRVKVNYNQHKQHPAKNALVYGKTHARKTYYMHYMNQGMLPKINIFQLDGRHYFEYSVMDKFYGDYANSYEDALNKGICHVFENYKIREHGCEFC